MKRPLRSNGAARYPDMGMLRQAVKDDRLWCVRGIVYKPDDAETHFRIISSDGRPAEVLVEVLSVPSKHDLTCALTTVGGAPGAGYWAIPPVGTHVIVAIPDGEVAFHPAIVGVLSSGDVPGRLAPGRTVIVSRDPIEIIGPAILATNADDGQALATKADVQALRDWIMSDLKFAVASNVAGPVPTSVVAPTPAGTTVFRAK